MVNIKVVYLGLIMLLLFMSIVSAELKIEKEAVVNVVIPEIGNPAMYRLKITNLGKSDVFNIYSLVGVDIEPNQTFSIEQGKTKTIDAELWPEQSVLDKPGTFNFEYKIVGEKTGIQEDVMLIKVTGLKDAIKINSYNINFDSEKAIVYVKNRGNFPFPEISARFKSVFFDFERSFSLGAYETKEFEVALDREAMRKLVAGSYIITTEIETYGIEGKIEDSFRFTEKEQITRSEEKKGILISTLIIENINEGNLPTVVRDVVEKNVISRLFTNFNIEPIRTERDGFRVTYIFQKEVMPAENFKIKVVTNWFYPLILIAAIIAVALLVQRYTSTSLLVKKRASYVKTKGGEFALKVTILVKAKNFVDKITLVDKIPLMMKVHERFGVIEPDSIDEKNRRMMWNIEGLQGGEERIFSYIIYSRLSPIGKFEVPPATALYEKDGRVFEVRSNKVFFITEPRKREE